jgi:hypothetical protein
VILGVEQIGIIVLEANLTLGQLLIPVRLYTRADLDR